MSAKLTGKARILHERRSAARDKAKRRALYATVPVSGLTIHNAQKGR